MPKILLIGGSDGSCGAGLFADFETLHELNSSAHVVVTSVTSQNDQRFDESLIIPSKNIKSQLDVISSNTCQVVKVGMLPNVEAVMAVSEYFSTDMSSKVIVDPVLSSSSGGVLSSHATLDAMKQLLFPLVDLITPNLSEARLILGLDENHQIDLTQLAQDCLQWSSKAVLLKGGHLEGDTCIDVFVEKENLDDPIVLKRKKLNGGTSIRGTGCRLASAIAHFYGSGSDLRESVMAGTNYLQSYLKEKLKEN